METSISNTSGAQCNVLNWFSLNSYQEPVEMEPHEDMGYLSDSTIDLTSQQLNLVSDLDGVLEHGLSHTLDTRGVGFSKHIQESSPNQEQEGDIEAVEQALDILASNDSDNSKHTIPVGTNSLEQKPHIPSPRKTKRSRNGKASSIDVSNQSKQPRRSSRQSKDDPVYEVEKIISCKRDKTGKPVSYLVKWLGYDNAHNTNVSVKDLVNCKHLLDQFESKSKFSKVKATKSKAKAKKR